MLRQRINRGTIEIKHYLEVCSISHVLNVQTHSISHVLNVQT